MLDSVGSVLCIISLSGTNISVGIVILDPNSLGTVQFTTFIPFMKQKYTKCL